MLAHVFLHVALCSAVARLSPEANVAMHVRMSYRVGGSELDKVFTFARGDTTQAFVEFDIPQSDYVMRLDVPKYKCSAAEFVHILADQNRKITETLSDRASAEPDPVLLMEGTAPLSFSYVKPTFVLLGNGAACDSPVSACRSPFRRIGAAGRGDVQLNISEEMIDGLALETQAH